MDIRTLLVDAPYLFKRSYNGAKNLYTPEFGHIGGLYQFLTKVRMLIKQHQINKVVLMWDGDNSGRDRHLLDHTYKANRTSKDWHVGIQLTEEEIKREVAKDKSALIQMKTIRTYAEELFFRQIQIKEIEADDLIAEYCMRYHNEEDIFVYTNDRDIAQMLDLNITILFGNIDDPITRRNFSLNFNYHYSNVLTLKILCGDTSDNIIGIKGIGEKGLITAFPELTYKHLSVNDVCNKAIKVNKERVENKKKPLKKFQNIVENVDRLIMNHKLMNLREPFLNEKAYDALDNLEIPLDDSERGSKYLYWLMMKDGFLSAYGYDFVSYVEPFYPVIMKEIDTLKKYNIKHNF